jgi:hypothetical protein
MSNAVYEVYFSTQLTVVAVNKEEYIRRSYSGALILTVAWFLFRLVSRMDPA